MAINRLNTPPKFDTPEDPKNKPSVYPNGDGWKTRDGHSDRVDSTSGNEHRIMEHRSGTSITMHPDGAFEITSHKGRYDVTFGEQRIKISGSYDTVIDGDHSVKTKGNHNQTIDGDSAMSIKGASVVTAKSQSTTIAENSDSVVGTETKKVNNSSTTQIMGAASMTSSHGMVLGSTGSATAIGGAQGVGIKSGAAAGIESAGGMSIRAGGDIAFDGPMVYINSGRSETATNIAQMSQPPAPTTEA